MKKILTILFAGFCIVTTACAQDEETRTLDAFQGLSVGESIRVTLIEGDKNEAVITTTNVDTDKVLTEINGGDLRIHMESGSYTNNTVEVVLTYTQALDKIKVSSSGRISGKGTVRSKELYLKASSSGRMELDVDVEQLKIDVSSSGKISLSGQTKTQVIDASSSGKYHAFGVDSEGVRVDVSSSGKVEVSVGKELRADASSSGKVVYRGSPDKVLADTSSSGSVRRD
ncbi:head GIN domain-containing protein [Reichenbachiella sp. MSK19-1]|uniref:head GIN domain-containing protein n=1 Tax=Reichenbachiella sp. MSK19-1 TaxID=1897631 RepID=UPI000ED9EA8F|nr:head GIN domain-containing protein [Reichenbachiella sp. MSK19-1]RJE74580.1 hypothetical protein BGP76_15670 [Reichenbachiella sp. MSK19-1]